MRTTLLYLLLIIGLSRAEAQVNYNDIHSSYFQKIYKIKENRGNHSLPFLWDKRVDHSYIRRNRIRPVSVPYHEDLKFYYINIDKNNKNANTAETDIFYVFFETNGNYILSVIWNWSADHIVSKYWLVTFDLWGQMIDRIPFAVYYTTSGENIHSLEGEISKDMKVDVYELDFPDNERIYDVENSKPFNNLRGQRIDRHYQITPEGKFNLLRTVRYEPQIYTPEMLMDKTCIFQRNEKPLE